MFSLAILSSCAIADRSSIVIPESNTDRLTSQNTNLSTSALFNAYIGKDLLQRRLAEMYVIGVIDSTEGELWCDFKIASPNAIKEQVFNALKSGTISSPQKRASSTIKNKLKNLLPCRESK